MKNTLLIILFVSVGVGIVNAQDGRILPGQKSAIQSLSTAAGFTSADLNTYLVQNYGQTLDGLSRVQGAIVIKAFQTGSPPEPPVAKRKKEEDIIIETYLSSLNKRERKKAKKEGGKFLKNSSKVRVWSTQSGSSVKAILGKNSKNKVILIRENDLFTMVFRKEDLSLEDQDYIAQIELVVLADGYFVPLDILGKGIKTYPKPKYPADLAMNIQFNEPSGNNALDADEKATIILKITNNGMGEAYGVEPQINLNSSISGLTIGDFEAIDKILPNTTVKAQTSVSAGRKILSQNVELEVNVTEHNGFDLYPAGLLRIQTKALLPPKLVLADVGIDDLTNSNGRIDPNEIIEATAIIHNIGQGIAKNVNVDVNYGDNIFNAGDSKTSFSIGTMQPNETRQVAFQFFATRKAQEDLPISLNITEQYQKYGSNQSAGLSLNKEFKKSTEVIIAAKENKLVEITSVDGISVDIEKNIPKTGMKNRDAIAVVIGNKEYTGDVPNVDFAVRDAQFVKEYLIKTMGYREGNIFYYANATKAQIGVAFKKLKNAVKKNKSDVFVYYSGHGAPDPESKQGYFVPVDADPNFIMESGYPVDDLYQLLDDTNARNTIVVIDACFSGSSDQGMILKDISPVFIEVDDSFLNSKNSAVFTSATGEQVSSWYRDKSHSLFTYYFLKGLQGEADLDSDGTLILSEIKDYIDDNVPYMARRINNREQYPQLMTDDDTKVLVTY